MATTRKILILAANPKGTVRLRLDKEVREIKNCLRLASHRDRFSVEQEWAVRLVDLRRALLNHKPDIVHFSGHADEQGIFLEDDNDKAIMASSEILGNLFELFQGQIECVLLNACYSVTQAHVISRHINYVIGISQEICDETAITFAVGFYDGLGAGRSIEEAFKLGRTAATQTQNVSADAFVILSDPSSVIKPDGPVIPQPPGTPYDPRWYIHREDEERMALNDLGFPGKPVLLWGPKRFGKTTLLQYLLSQFQRNNDEQNLIATVNIGSFSEENWKTYDGFLHEFASRLVDEINGSPEWVFEMWRLSHSANQKLTMLIRDYILSKTSGKLILGIDQLDAIRYSTFAYDFLQLLRAYAEKANQHLWSHLRLILASSSNPSLMVQDSVGSPLYNLCDPIRIEDLHRAQVDALAQRYKLDWTDNEISLLMHEVGGHPYLVRLVMYHAALHRVSLSELLGYRPQGTIFDNFLRGELRYLERSGLAAKVHQMLEHGPNISDEDYHRLHAAGLVVKDRNKNEVNTYRLRYEKLYKRLFM